jgi:protein-L-isoaspartate(D-aspartate) O-methyltransferase
MDFQSARITMLKQQVKACKVLDPHVLAVLETTHREDFVPAPFKALAFVDEPIPLAHEQQMLAPMVEAAILQALQIKKTDRVLEVGTGSGYLTALLAKCAAHVYSIDYFDDFTRAAEERLKEHGITNATLKTGDASHGWLQFAPYDVIVITASLPALPEEFKQQLNVGGRLVAIIGEAPAMKVNCYTRQSTNRWEQTTLFETETPRLMNVERPQEFEF